MNERESASYQLSAVRGTLRKHLPRLRRDYSISSLQVFGSFVRGEQKIDSDVDLLVEFDVPPSLFVFVELEDELTRLLGIKVDLVMKDGLRPSLGASILREALQV